MKGTRWVIVDTETDGLCEPIHVVELAGQLMEGWEPIAEPFRMLLNHNVPIPPEAVALHGYTEEYLRKHGQEPVAVYELFRNYACGYPFVAHNLSYDWNRCLEPEWARLGVPRIGQRGFCSMMLARRLAPETRSYRLEALKACYQLSQSLSHRAKNDVFAVVELFQRVYRPRLESAGFDTFEAVAAFAKRTPVAKCLDLIRAAATTQGTPSALKDEWYFLDAASNAHGPLPARQVGRSAGIEAFYVWREGMADWAVNRECAEFLALCQSPLRAEPPARRFDDRKTMSELVGLCRGLIADNEITTAEVMFLSLWLQDAGFVTEWPASEIAHTVERILDDGVVTKEEKQELQVLIRKITADSSRFAPQPGCHASLVADSVVATPVTLPQYTVVDLEQGTLEWLRWRHQGIGASDAPVVMGENPWKSPEELLREKRGPAREFTQNAAMARGVLLEPEARRRYVMSRGVDVHPVCIQSSQHEWLRASLDGLSVDGNVVVEIKCGESVYQRTAICGSVPDYYYGQLQHILAITGLASLDFWCYLPGRPELLVSVERDEGYIERLLNAESRFWQNVIQKHPRPRGSEVLGA